MRHRRVPALGTRYASREAENLSPDARDHLRDGFIRGTELVDGTARLAAMNLLLHGIGKPDGDSLITVGDALTADPGDRYSVVLANPPFGRKSAVTMIGADGRESRDDLEIVRQDFWVTTANKQLNFVQHIKTILEINGRAAVVLPDNVLFEGGAGRRSGAGCCASSTCTPCCGCRPASSTPGVKANVLFFDKKPASETPWTSRLWVYDLRTNKHYTLKQNQLRRADLDDFVELLRARQTARLTWSSPSGGNRSPTTNSWRGTRRTSTSPGCATTLSKTWTTCPRPRSSPARSSTT